MAAEVLSAATSLTKGMRKTAMAHIAVAYLALAVYATIDLVNAEPISDARTGTSNAREYFLGR